MPRYLVALALLLACLGSAPSEARNLGGRVGVGVGYHDFADTAGFSVRYYANPYYAATLYLGFDTDDQTGSSSFGVKLFRMLNLEENLNFFAGVAGYLLSRKSPLPGANASGAEIDLLLGAEFFLPGLPSLGFQFEAGMAVRSVARTSLKSIGAGFGGLALHYYFF